MKSVQGFQDEAPLDDTSQDKARTSLKTQLELTLPKFTREPKILLPKLGPFEGESGLEPINRVMSVSFRQETFHPVYLEEQGGD